MAALTDSEIDKLTQMLSELKIGGLPTAVFNEMARLVVMPAVEIIPLRLDSNGRPCVLLLRRDDTDPIWPRLWHTPGRILRSTDVDDSRTYATAIRHLAEAELPGVKLGDAVFVQNDFRIVNRGGESAVLHWMEVLDEDVPVGRFFPVDALPGDLVDHHGRMIQTVADHFMKSTFDATSGDRC